MREDALEIVNDLFHITGSCELRQPIKKCTLTLSVPRRGQGRPLAGAATLLSIRSFQMGREVKLLEVDPAKGNQKFSKPLSLRLCS